MQQDKFMLLATAVLGALAALFATIAVATPGWNDRNRNTTTALFKCGTSCGHNYTAAGVLLIISIVILAIGSLITILFTREFMKNNNDRIKALVLALFVIAGIFIVSAYSQAVINSNYSYHLAVTAGILTFLSAIFFTYWAGRVSVVRSP